MKVRRKDQSIKVSHGCQTEVAIVGNDNDIIVGIDIVVSQEAKRQPQRKGDKTDVTH